MGPRKPKPGQSLAELKPELALEWHPTMNGALSPADVGKASRAMVWWQCDEGHEWTATVANRVASQGCRKCIHGTGASGIEQTLCAWLADCPYLRVNPVEALPLSWRRRKTMRVDLIADLLPSDRRVAVEYDGEYWHAGKADVDIAKTRALLDAGYLVIRVRENELDYLPLQDHRLLQLQHRWSAGAQGMDVTVEAIEHWLEGWTRADQ